MTKVSMLSSGGGDPWHGSRCSARTLKVSRGPGVEGSSQVVKATLSIRVQRHLLVHKEGRVPEAVCNHPQEGGKGAKVPAALATKGTKVSAVPGVEG